MNVTPSRPASAAADPDTARPADPGSPAGAGDLFAVLVAALSGVPSTAQASGQPSAAQDAPGQAAPSKAAPSKDAPDQAAPGEGGEDGEDGTAAAGRGTNPPPALTALLAAAAQAGALGIVPAIAGAAAPPAAAASGGRAGGAAGIGPDGVPGADASGSDLTSARPPAAAGVPAAPATPATTAVSAGLPALPATPAVPAAPAEGAVRATPQAGLAPDLTGPAGGRGTGPAVRVHGVGDHGDRHQDLPAQAARTDISAGQNPQLGGPYLATRGATGGDSAGFGVGRQVAAAVGDQVARLVSRGDGTRRLTLQLQPAALGDVRVTLTVRDGQVHVALAAGTDAQAALLRDAPELHRLLERVGASQPQIVVRGLPAAPAVAGAGTTAQPDGRPTDQSGAGPSTGLPSSGQQGGALGPHTGGHSQDRRAWTPAATSARDGGQPAAGRSDPGRPIDPATRVRTAGVDVSM